MERQRVKARYPIKIGNVLIPAGEEGRVATLEEARWAFPKLELKEGSSWVSVIFRDLKPCIVDRRQVLMGHAC